MAGKVVYVHYRADDGLPFYVGMGERDRAHEMSSRNKFWKNVKRKHGVVVDIVAENLSVEEAWDLEKKLIKELRSEFGTLTNLSDGGEGSPGLHGIHNANFKHFTVLYNDEFALCFTSAKQMDECGFSSKMIYNTTSITSNRFYVGDKKIRFLVLLTDDIREVENIMDSRRAPKISDAKLFSNTGVNHHSFGNTLSDEHKEKLRKASTGKIHSEKSKKKISNAQTGKRNHAFKGYTIGTNGKQYVIACGSKELTSLGFNQGLVSQCILGRKPHHKSFKWYRSNTLDKSMFVGMLPYSASSMAYLFGFDFCVSKFFIRVTSPTAGSLHTEPGTLLQ